MTHPNHCDGGMEKMTQEAQEHLNAEEHNTLRKMTGLDPTDTEEHQKAYDIWSLQSAINSVLGWDDLLTTAEIQEIKSLVKPLEEL